jgi:hypothetical protein
VLICKLYCNAMLCTLCYVRYAMPCYTTCYCFSVYISLAWEQVAIFFGRSGFLRQGIRFFPFIFTERLCFGNSHSYLLNKIINTGSASCIGRKVLFRDYIVWRKIGDYAAQVLRSNRLLILFGSGRNITITSFSFDGDLLRHRGPKLFSFFLPSSPSSKFEPVELMDGEYWSVKMRPKRERERERESLEFLGQLAREGRLTST